LSRYAYDNGSTNDEDFAYRFPAGAGLHDEIRAGSGDRSCWQLVGQTRHFRHQRRKWRLAFSKMPPKVLLTPTNCGLSPSKKVSARRIEVEAVLKVRRTEIVPAPASANINSSGRGAYLFPVRVKRVQQTGLIQPDVGLDSRQRILAYKKCRLDRAIMAPKPYNAPRGIIRPAVVWKINHLGALLFADRRQP
jgi:hypothetical protein